MSAVAKVTRCPPVAPPPCVQEGWNVYESVIVAISLVDMALPYARGLCNLVSVTLAWCIQVLLTCWTVSPPHRSPDLRGAVFCFAVAVLQAGPLVAPVPGLPQGHAEIFLSPAHRLLWLRGSRLPTVPQALHGFRV